MQCWNIFVPSMRGKDVPKVGLLTYNNAYGKTIHAPSKEYAAKHGINIVGIE